MIKSYYFIYESGIDEGAEWQIDSDNWYPTLKIAKVQRMHKQNLDKDIPLEIAKITFEYPVGKVKSNE